MTVDIVKIIGNLSLSLEAVQNLIAGLGYLLGVIFIFAGVLKFYHMADSRVQSRSREGTYIPLAYCIFGSFLVFLPSALQLFSTSAFGYNNVLEYVKYNPYDIYNSMGILIKTAGLIWFVRGCVILIHASQPGARSGHRGVLYLITGIFALNFEATIGAINFLLLKLIHLF